MAPSVSTKRFEKLGAFYLGRTREGAGGPFLYDSKDLTTHGLVVGMTGSGKTGLSVVLLEEAALDGIPALIIDPKGDMGNLMLQFPRLATEDFRPWVDASEATRRGLSRDQYAAETAAMWEKGITAWGQSKGRIGALRRAAEARIYTPGSTAGRPIAVLRAFDAPGEAVREDPEALGDRVVNAASGLLGLVGLDADPVTSREHILLSNLLERAWRDGEDRDLETIVREVQDPPFKELGVLDLETFFPRKDRFTLAAKLNNLLASPAFAGWREGEPLEIPRLLFTPEGKPRLAILSIAHLSDEERMFFVTLLLNEVISWMRGLEGTGSLRAILYMDEIFGYFPPVKSPPSKAPMLTLLKQARAYGLGVLLATQNPVDLDYKGLANIGTWFLGRLQTERDRDRLMDGLASSSGGAPFDRKKTAELVASLDKRVFLTQNVHEDRPVLLEVRWALSYLRGPLTLSQVKELTGPRDLPKKNAASRKKHEVAPVRPRVPSTVDECFLAGDGGDEAIYAPNILTTVQLHYVRAGYGVDHWEKIHSLTPLEDDGPDFPDGEDLPEVLEEEPRAGAGFAALPDAATDEKSYRKWQKSLLAYLYRERPLTLFRCKSLKMYSRPGEDEGAFRVRLVHALREKRDEAIEKLRQRYAPKLATLEKRVRGAEVRLGRESDQYTVQKAQAAISFGETLLGALFGRKILSGTNVGRASRTARSATRASRERGDVARAERELKEQRRKLAELERELTEKTAALRGHASAENLEVEALTLRLRKSDTTVERFALAWRR